MKGAVLIVDDEPDIQLVMSVNLKKEGYDVDTAGDGQEALKKLESRDYDVIVLDHQMPRLTGMQFLERLRSAPLASTPNADVPVIVITAYGTIEMAVQAMKDGAYSYLTKPIQYEDLSLQVKNALERRRLSREVRDLRQEVEGRYHFGNLIGSNPRMQDVFQIIRTVADTDATVLIQGESGTGKELVARAIHYNSPFRDEPFIVINCSAIQDTLLESELFGHVKGAFTDAVSETKGKFEIAGKGTLFLDEVGDVSPNLQSKLLRVIESRDFMKVGGEKVLKTEARIIAATNQNLKALIDKGRFREDLFYRLKVVEIVLPALRERREDIPDLVAYLLEKINRELRRNVRKVPPEVMKVLVDMPWRGNVRELENALTRAAILAKGDVLLKENLPLEPDDRRTFSDELVPLEEVEKKYIQHVLNAVRGSKTRASQILQISRPTLDKKIKEYGLELGETV